ncbi:MAG: hypothetical protein MUF31_03690 [Akkermansiaceae bacterium]|jgi:hypothetical protein|nr:hypothetical protein [Akkermansiaceae bacterium]
MSRTLLCALLSLLFLPCQGQQEEALLDVDEVTPAEDEIASTGGNMAGPGGQRVVSESGQFGVSGGDAGLRGSVAMQADGVRAKFIRLAGEAPERKMAIEIELVGKAGDAPKARPLAYQLRHTEARFVLRLYVDVSRGIPHERLEEALIASLLMDRALADVPVGELARPLSVPPWLVVGIREAWAWAEELGDRRLYESVFQKGGGFELEELMAMPASIHERLDGVSRAIFRAQSGAMVMALLGQPGGAEGFAALCAEIPDYEGEMPLLLRQRFPEMNLSEKSLAKWWALTLAKLADARLTEVMNIRETEEALAAALVLSYADAQGARVEVPLEKWRELPEMGGAARFEAVRPVQDALGHLSFRCFPSYRPLLLSYQEWLAAWAKEGDGEAIDLAELAETREIFLQRGLRARDYLDYVEIKEATEISGSFEDYLLLKEQLKERKRAPRTDPLSRYLETLDAVYAPKKSAK